MVYVCHKVGLLFPLCNECEEYKACEAAAKILEVEVEPQLTVNMTA